jgi:hypothetical protein
VEKNPMKSPRARNWLPSLHDPSPPRLWRIGYALAAFIASRLGSGWGPGYGTLRGADFQAIIEFARLG